MNQPYQNPSVTYFGRNRWMTALGFVPWVLCALALLTAITTREIAFVPISCILFLGGRSALTYMWRRNPRARRVPVAVSADQRGVRIEGEEALPPWPRAELKEGFVIPGLDEVRVRLVRRAFRPPLDLAVPSEADARALLRSLGLDASQTVASFRVLSRMVNHSRTIGAAATVVGLMSRPMEELVRSLLGSWVLSGAFLLLLALFMFAVASLMVVPARLDVGADGVLLKWLWRKRFIPYREIDAMVPSGKKAGRPDFRGVILTLRSGEEVRIPVVWGDWDEERAAIVEARLNEAMGAYKKGDAEADAMLLRRGDRSMSAWLTSLRAIGAGANADLRVAPVAPERLFRIVEDPSAQPTARAAAAVALSVAVDDAGRARLKAAAVATVARRLRVALEAAAGSGSDAALEEALAELEAADAKKQVKG